MATITSLSATQGKAGDSLTINGSGFGTSAVTVNFGSKTVAATGATTTVTTTVPSGCAGQTNVSVTVGTSTSNSKAFFYIATPVCSAVVANTGPLTPPAVNLTGTGFATATAVTFGVAGAGTINSKTGDSLLNASPPTNTTGFTTPTQTVDVTVTSPGGTSVPAGASSQFTYYNLPTVTGVSPSAGSAGQTGVTVSGTNLVDVSDVIFTDTVTAAVFHATDVVGLLDTEVQFTTPAGLVTASSYTVTVTTPGGTSTTSATFGPVT